MFNLEMIEKRNSDGSLMSLDEIAADLMQIDFDEDNIRFITGYFEDDTGRFDHTCWVMFEQVMHTRYGVPPENTHGALVHFINAMKAKYPEHV